MDKRELFKKWDQPDHTLAQRLAMNATNDQIYPSLEQESIAGQLFKEMGKDHFEFQIREWVVALSFANWINSCKNNAVTST